MTDRQTDSGRTFEDVAAGFTKLLYLLPARDWWSTWTFDREYSAMSASKAWVRFMSLVNPEACYLYVVEANRWREGTHVHAVVGNVRNLRRKDIWQRWFKRYGRCHIVPFKQGQTGWCGRYVAKYMCKGLCWWDISIPGQTQTEFPWLHGAVRSRQLDDLIDVTKFPTACKRAVRMGATQLVGASARSRGRRG